MPDPFRLRMKVWTDATGKLFMCAAGYLELRTDRMTVYAMSDEKTCLLSLSVDEWNNLPYRFFKEDGPAPKPEKRYTPDPIGGGPVVG